MVETLHTDILILGSGGAGLFAALHAAQANPHLDITVATKGLVGKSGCTRMVQGGYNVALHKGDSIERHFMDTIRQIAQKFAEKSPVVMKLGRDAFMRAVDADYRRAVEHAAETFCLVATTKDCQEGLAAFTQKRKPRYTGE